jgi:hypothetical protein
MSVCLPQIGATKICSLTGLLLQSARSVISFVDMFVPAACRMFWQLGGRRVRVSALLSLLAMGMSFSTASATPVETGTAATGGLSKSTKIIHVKNLNDSGSGSLREALKKDGPRVIVFDIGGAIELKSDLRIETPNVTIAGQSAPAPGITLHGRPLKIRASNVVVQHITVRPWNEPPPEKGDQFDAITVTACETCASPASDVLLENVSVSWSVDEGIGLWGENLKRVTIRNSLIAEALRNAGHPKGVHSMGLLIGAKISGVEVAGNLFISNLRRNPVVGGGASAFVANNYIYNPGRNSVHVYRGAGTRVSLIGNVTKQGPDTYGKITPFQIQGDLAADSPGARIYAADNHNCDSRGNGCSNRLSSQPLSSDPATVSKFWKVMPAQDVWAWVSRFAGSRPAKRGNTDTRIVSGVESGNGKVIDSPLEVGGDTVLPSSEPSPQLPSNPLGPAGAGSKTRLEAWLCLRHFEVGGPQTPQCPESAEELRTYLNTP